MAAVDLEEDEAVEPAGPPLHELELVHYTSTKRPLGELVDVEAQDAPEMFKPIGLWLSVEPAYSWRWWASNERFWKGDYLAYRLRLRPDANVLHVNGTAELDAFHERFKHETDLGPSTFAPPPRPAFMSEAAHARMFPKRYVLTRINWPAVAEEYDGLVIAPYVWGRRFARNMLWYYGWDCASGCIWRPSKAVERVEPLGLVDFSEDPDE